MALQPSLAPDEPKEHRDDLDADDVLPAGRFSTWLLRIGRAEGEDADVPCNGCTACCTSSQFIHIAPNETDTLARIPAALLFPAPGLPKGHVLLGYDHHGHCPMFVDQRCSIYADRPRTCRSYDCRVLPAAGLGLDDPTKAAISARIERWRFDMASEDDQRKHDAVRAAATFLGDHADELPVGWVPRQATQLAFLAIGIHEAFLNRDHGPGADMAAAPTLDAVREAIDAVRTAPS